MHPLRQVWGPCQKPPAAGAAAAVGAAPKPEKPPVAGAAPGAADAVPKPAVAAGAAGPKPAVAGAAVGAAGAAPKPAKPPAPPGAAVLGCAGAAEPGTDKPNGLFCMSVPGIYRAKKVEKEDIQVCFLF
ncbi:hypothetical protein STCU_12169 [Strigomonas culicis]|uniref:Uncharacterized protein n=1 Tax=Strigomonas culicis TaxID=28005 RepID=S9TB94_9TRYP|nr:hypothetical protein STCU_12169 [Strigomonas culicis]|eukprot:EPY15277.1 hypothetical protein STCU_12169 [Strigomonas culicis]